MPPSSSPSAPSPDDAEIVRSLRERDAAGLRLLLTVHGSITRTCVKKTFGDALSDLEIDDVMNKAAFNAWRAADSFDPAKGSLRAWFLVIARNAGRGVLRSKQQRRFETRGDDIDGVAATATDEIPSVPPSGFLAAVRACIEALPRMQRQVIKADLRSGDVANADELAKTLRTTKNSIYVSRSMARQTLKRRLLEQGYVPGDGRSQPLWN
jgi:RNA polymerase sigma factor (sigma-70 family)